MLHITHIPWIYIEIDEWNLTHRIVQINIPTFSKKIWKIQNHNKKNLKLRIREIDNSICLEMFPFRLAIILKVFEFNKIILV